MDKILVKIALQKAEAYEKQGNKAKAGYWLDLAEQVEGVYNRIEKNGSLNEKFRSNE